MSDQQSTNTSRHVYRLSWWAVTLYLAVATLGAALFTLSIIALGWVIIDGDWSFFKDWRVSPVVILLGIGGAFIVEGSLKIALRSKLVLDGTRITVCNGREEKSADLSEVEGYRMAGGKGSAFWSLRLKGGGSLAINQWFHLDDAFRDILARLQQLDGAGGPGPDIYSKPR